MSDKLTFTVNGIPVSTSRPRGERLLDLLRDDLSLTGTKSGCNSGDCGACTVLIDGEQHCACLTSIGKLKDKSIQTVEGLSGDAELNNLQRAFLKAGAAQCGVCSPGMLMAAHSLLQENSAPTETQVKDALGGVLCRCTGYQKIVEAVLMASKDQVDLSDPTVTSDSIGKSVLKVDGEEKLNGAARYGADVIPDDALYIRVLRSPYHRAEVVFPKEWPSADEFDGITDILGAQHIPNNRYGIYPEGKDQTVLSEGVVRYRGEAIVALVGEKDRLSDYSLDDFGITLNKLPEIMDAEEALAKGAPEFHEGHPNNILISKTLRSGEEGVVGKVSSSGSFCTSFVEHAAIEPEAGYAYMDEGRLVIHASTQAVHMDLQEVAHITGMAASDIRIIPTEVGGGFGGKLDVSVQPLLAIAALRSNRPVAFVYSRSESMQASPKRHAANITADFSADRNGHLVSAKLYGRFNTGAYASWGPTVAGRVPVHGTGPYRVPNAEITGEAIYANGPIAGAFRGFGVPQVAIAHECLMDDLALELGLDPLEIRIKNALQAGDVTATGQKLAASTGLTACLEALKPKWQHFKEQATSLNNADSSARYGVGIGAMWYGIGNTSLSNPSEMEVGLTRDGKLVFLNGAVDIGQGSNTVLLQIAAAASGFPVDQFTYVMGDSDLTRDAGKTSASRQTFVSGKAAEIAGLDIRQKILRQVNASEKAELSLIDGNVQVKDSDETHVINLRQLSPDEDGYVFKGFGRFDPPTTDLDENGQGTPYATYAFAAQIAFVEVDTELGTVKVKNIVAAHDVGQAINPQQVEGQIHGGIAQGLGLALMEEYIPGKTENLHDYLIPTFGDMPDIESILIEDPEPLGPYGAKGIGEPALVPTAPAIFGAIRNATGVRVTQAPMTPTRLQKAIRDLSGS
ncbi:molybdopterin-dependent oxidoreductase [Sneathiella sp. P13V-1]|uniref:molybdopterin-dependent oxidoreductase n=1 Tax=Sneathiella sp. P13V-1 TaxID=2697366 RepID=UPI00187B4CC7|nr:molybdopterin cofactor-binding domain-containing protein [Sneathiella sp. P13V-1]MBE7637256.1 molybdopterin-dependent oxidoreductase [Sneathiella sp. P13V-1]